MSRKELEQKIDFVITWVDGADPSWQRKRAQYAEKDARDAEWFDNPARYRDWGLLRYWFRGVEQNAGWVNKIFFVTDGQVPEWLNVDNPKLVLVKHSDFMDKQYLPTFNSNAIELNLHNIRGLSERFVYFNDDMFILGPTKREDFFKDGLPRVTVGMDCVHLDYEIGHSEINNMKILNKYFDKRAVVKKYLPKWLSLRNGVKQVYKTIILMPWERFTGLYESHLPCSYLKRTFEAVWEKEYGELERTCMNKIRSGQDYSHWLMKGFQIANGNFRTRSPGWGKMFLEDVDDKIVSVVEGRKCKVVCINDVPGSDETFLRSKKLLEKAFSKIYPDKSSFEK